MLKKFIYCLFFCFLQIAPVNFKIQNGIGKITFPEKGWFIIFDGNKVIETNIPHVHSIFTDDDITVKIDIDGTIEEYLATKVDGTIVSVGFKYNPELISLIKQLTISGQFLPPQEITTRDATIRIWGKTSLAPHQYTFLRPGEPSQTIESQDGLRAININCGSRINLILCTSEEFNRRLMAYRNSPVQK